MYLARQSYTFPEQDLIYHLIHLYFENSNIIFPILHRPSFEKDLHDGKHTLDCAFGRVVLLVCALGSRFSEDQRVLLPESNSRLSSGWAWFSQIQFEKLIFSASPLYDLQTACLGAIYLLGTSAYHASWNLVGMGLRIAQEIGIHRKKLYSLRPTANDELFKRCFWTLLWIDREIGAVSGRPCAIQEEDFDVDMPIACDDEYWTHPDPDKAFRQPLGRPSRLDAFICQLKLLRILGYSLRTIHASEKAKCHFGLIGDDWERRTVADFDRVLNEWVDCVPNYLRWDPTREDDVLFFQSAHLFTQFYDLQILIHRPFISPRRTSPHHFSSVAVCVNAARACSRIVSRAQERWSGRMMPFFQRPVYMAVMVLLLGIWNAKQSILSFDVEKEMSSINKCIHYLRTVEEVWHVAGRIQYANASLP
ncbi:fungal-specific transcription factor domain-containing protein [Vararia minispora EC-137]|uniref:Fungal-specific transcription factor domain-containing protein n=1 Tax=Vararia minispora EC-137 TaxID=1314806 RepID=A0ACB8QYM1_9AGAM|nr:fungal-specific transcription factor domain-containing protein [Vararia minispora EC-137]